MSDNETTIPLPQGPFTKHDWALKLRSHFKTDPNFGINPWEQTFEKLVEYGKFKEDGLGNGKYILNVVGLEERDVLKAFGEVEKESLTSLLKKNLKK
jgi:hypothetical protein